MSERIYILSDEQVNLLIDVLFYERTFGDWSDDQLEQIDALFEKLNSGGTEHITALVDVYGHGEQVSATFWTSYEDAMLSHVLDTAYVAEAEPYLNYSIFANGPAPLSTYLRDDSVPLEERFNEAVEWWSEHKETSVSLCQNGLNTEVTSQPAPVPPLTLDDAFERLTDFADAAGYELYPGDGYYSVYDDEQVCAVGLIARMFGLSNSDLDDFYQGSYGDLPVLCGLDNEILHLIDDGFENNYHPDRTSPAYQLGQRLRAFAGFSASYLITDESEPADDGVSPRWENVYSRTSCDDCAFIGRWEEFDLYHHVSPIFNPGVVFAYPHNDHYGFCCAVEDQPTEITERHHVALMIAIDRVNQQRGKGVTLEETA